MNHSNKDGKPLAESAEERPLIKENARQPNTHPTQSGKGVSQGLAGVRKAAKENKEMKFTALLHHLTIELLRESFYSLKRKAAPGIDGVTTACWTILSLVANYSSPEPETPDLMDTHSRFGSAMAPSTACAPSLSGCTLRRHSSEIRTGCANQRPPGSVRGVPRRVVSLPRSPTIIQARFRSRACGMYIIKWRGRFSADRRGRSSNRGCWQ